MAVGLERRLGRFAQRLGNIGGHSSEGVRDSLKRLLLFALRNTQSTPRLSWPSFFSSLAILARVTNLRGSNVSLTRDSAAPPLRA